MGNYLQKRNGVYYFKKRVISNLSTNRNHTIRKSLQTKCYTTAKKLSSLLNYWVNVYFEVGIIMTNKRMDEILYKYLQNSIEENNEYEDLRHENNSIEKKGKFFEGSTKKALLHHLKKHNKLDKTRNPTEIKEYVEKEIIPISMIEKNELEELREMKSFYWKLFKYYGEVLESDLNKFEGYSVDKSISKYKKNKPSETIINNYYSRDSNIKKADKNDEIDDFEIIVDKYINHLVKKQKIKVKTVEDYVPSYNIIKEAFPKLKLSDLTTENLEELEDIISFLPAFRFGKKLTKDLNIHEQIAFMKNILNDRRNKIIREEHKKYNVVAERTQNKHFEQISNFIDYAARKYKFESPLDGIVLQRYKIKGDASNERLLLTDDDIKKVFAEFDYLNGKLFTTLKKDPLKIYGIFLIMYMGIRPSEAGQLMINDLKKTTDSKGNTIHYLSVSKENTSDDKSLDDVKSEKTDNARRKLPLTDVFIKDLKFLEFVKHRKKEKHKFIFINEEPNKPIKEVMTNTVRRCGDRFNDKINSLDLENIDKKVFYSLRHSFANKIKKLPEALRDKRGESLMGHSGATDSELFDRYGNKYFEPDFLYEILEKVEYEEIDLDRFSKNIEKLF